MIWSLIEQHVLTRHTHARAQTGTVGRHHTSSFTGNPSHRCLLQCNAVDERLPPGPGSPDDHRPSQNILTDDGAAATITFSSEDGSMLTMQHY
jgi:hypothetical protein